MYESMDDSPTTPDRWFEKLGNDSATCVELLRRRAGGDAAVSKLNALADRFNTEVPVVGRADDYLETWRGWFLSASTAVVELCSDAREDSRADADASVPAELALAVETALLSRCHDKVFAAVRESCGPDDSALESLRGCEGTALREFLGSSALLAPHDFAVACNRLALLPTKGSPLAKLLCLRDTLGDITRSFQRRRLRPSQAGEDSAGEAPEPPLTPTASGAAAAAAAAAASESVERRAEGASASASAAAIATASGPHPSSAPCPLFPAASSPLCDPSSGACDPAPGDLPSRADAGAEATSSSASAPMTADDVLPLVIWLVATARVPGVASHLRLIELFFILHPSPRWPGNADLLKGQLGYVLATFQCAVAHLLFLARPDPRPGLGPGGGHEAPLALAPVTPTAGVSGRAGGVAVPPVRGPIVHRRSWSFALLAGIGTSPPTGPHVPAERPVPDSWERLGSPISTDRSAASSAGTSGRSPLQGTPQRLPGTAPSPSIHRRSQSVGDATPRAPLVPHRRLTSFYLWGLPISPLWGAGSGSGRALPQPGWLGGVELQCFSVEGDGFATAESPNLRAERSLEGQQLPPVPLPASPAETAAGPLPSSPPALPPSSVLPQSSRTPPRAAAAVVAAA